MLSVESPDMWTKQQVAKWVSDKCTEYEIDENEVSKLKSQNGKGLDRLSKEDWIRRSENHGDLFFNLWRELKQKITAEGITENKDILGNLKIHTLKIISYVVLIIYWGKLSKKKAKHILISDTRCTISITS
jgi:hypothetical protein